MGWFVSQRGVQRLLVLSIAWVVAMNAGAPPASASPIPGLLSPGSHALRLVKSGLDNGSVGEGSGSVDVVQDGTDTIETFNLSPEVLELVLTTGGLDTANPKVMLKELVLSGIYFTANPPVPWRPFDSSGQVQTTGWQWTLDSSNGGVTLQTWSWADPAVTVHVESGQAALIQHVRTFMSFGGTGSGLVEVDHWEVVGDSNQMIEALEGTVTIFGSPIQVDMMLLLGTLAKELRY